MQTVLHKLSQSNTDKLVAVPITSSGLVLLHTELNKLQSAGATHWWLFTWRIQFADLVRVRQKGPQCVEWGIYQHRGLGYGWPLKSSRSLTVPSFFCWPAPQVWRNHYALLVKSPPAQLGVLASLPFEVQEHKAHYVDSSIWLHCWVWESVWLEFLSLCLAF